MMAATTSTRPLLAATADVSKNYQYLEKLKQPQLLSVKIDGVRSINENGTLYSRTGKAFRNTLLQKKFSIIKDLDFEIVHGGPTDENLCDVTRGMCNSFSQPVGITQVFVFDMLGKDNVAFRSRHSLASRIVEDLGNPQIHIIEQVEVNSVEEILAFEEWALALGYEGIMGRRPRSPYKHGRSTDAEEFLWKMKRFTDEEVQIIGFIEETRNDNPLIINSQGYAERSSCKANLVPAGTLGRFIALWRGIEIVVSCGKLKHDQRQYIWDNKSKFLNVYFTMRFFGYGMRDLPRQGRFIQFRNPWDETLHINVG